VSVKLRPPVLTGSTIRVQTGLGSAWITINDTEAGPFEVFVNIGRGGSDIQADAEAIGRLISLILRMEDGLSQEQRLKEVIHQLRRIGGSRPNEYAESVPDGIARALKLYMKGDEDDKNRMDG